LSVGNAKCSYKEKTTTLFDDSAGQTVVICMSIGIACLSVRTNPYFILLSRKVTCLRARGSYFFNSSFSGLVRGFFLVT
jgi:hypothetical protein